ncbi:hypothetical protein [Anatilimnocola floriformis]|uniref:hypothetical protein n=1 Tax=Anatilimnocola floriformis TaxID=2948575 RepID=UPI0020C4558B|nr:hypothetical protein [Anatilimnocola floriformis]
MQHRLAGVDKQKGFRYYLSRPYIVVSKRILVHQDVLPGVLLQRDKSKDPMPMAGQVPADDVTADFAVRLILADGSQRTVDLAGHDNPAAKDWEPANLSAAMGMASIYGAEIPVSFAAQGDLEYLEFYRLQDFRADRQALTVAETLQKEILKTDGKIEEDPAIPSFQVAHLPDFEEQMAVKHHAFLSTNKFSMLFRDGWQLDSLKSNSDTTEVPIAILKTLQKAIGAASSFEQERLKRVAEIQGKGGENKDGGSNGAAALVPQRMAGVVRYYIEPGMYRVNKESERTPGLDEESPCGLLTSFGLPIATDTEIWQVASGSQLDKLAADKRQLEQDVKDCKDARQKLEDELKKKNKGGNQNQGGNQSPAPAERTTPPLPTDGMGAQVLPRRLPTQPSHGQLQHLQLRPPDVLRVGD